MGVGFCGEHILQNSVPNKYRFASVYFSRGTYSHSIKPYYNKVNFGPKYSQGDVVGCGIDWKSGSYFFTLNGQKHSELHLFPQLEQTLNSTVRDYTRWQTASETTLSTRLI
jgi:hypothetical protein